MNYFKIIILLILTLFLISCGTLKEGFTNQKKNSSDEFLVEKKSPLVMPPNYGELPAPKNSNTDTETETDETTIKNLIINEEVTGSDYNELQEKNRDFEENLIEKIRKN